MATRTGTLVRPLVTEDYRSRSSLRRNGLLVVLLGLGVAMLAFISSLVLTGRDASLATLAAQAAWTFGVATAALGVVKTGIALILWGIVRRVWIRIESIRAALPKLKPESSQQGPVREAPINTPYGSGRLTIKAPPSLFIHRVAYALWAPMLVMGAMAVALGLILSFFLAQAATDGSADTFNVLRALVPGVEFFGEALLLAGVSFLLGTILRSLREGGGEVQESVGVGIKTLSMPLTGKLFIALMVMGMMVEMVQLGIYIFVATLDNPATIGAYLTWLGPLREAGLGLLLSGIVLALGTIGKVLGFQFHRVTEIISTGR